MRHPQNAAERLASRHLPKDARLVLEHENGSSAYVYEIAGKFLMLAYWGTSAKPSQHYSYRTAEQRDAAIWRFREGVEQSLALRADMRAKRQAAVNTLKVGDIVNTSWGYDQTNVDFFVVTRATSKTVWVRRVAKDGEATGWAQGRCWPAMPIRMIGDETTHRATGGYLSINGHSASLTTGDCHESSYA